MVTLKIQQFELFLPLLAIYLLSSPSKLTPKFTFSATGRMEVLENYISSNSYGKHLLVHSQFDCFVGGDARDSLGSINPYYFLCFECVLNEGSDSPCEVVL